MWRWLVAVLAFCVFHEPVIAQDGAPPSAWTRPATLRWPNADIDVPSEVQSYILAECHRWKGFGEESLPDCIRAERYGYRAVVTMLEDPLLGAEAAERYRACAVGLGDQGGRYHRRKAECISCVYNIEWRYEFVRETMMVQPGNAIAGLGGNKVTSGRANRSPT